MPLDDLQRDPTAAWAISRTIGLEGGLVDNPHDPGGVTDFGVSLRFALQEVGVHPDHLELFDIDHDGRVGPADIRGMTRAEAAEIYYECFWKPGPYGRMLPTFIAWKVFDIAVNTGPKRAGIILQQALCARLQNVTVDGAIGPGTLAAVARERARDGGTGLLMELRNAQGRFYQGLVAQNADFGRFLKGWLNRAAQ